MHPATLLVLATLLGTASPLTQAVPKTIELPPETTRLRPSDLPGYRIASRKCGICHSADYIQFQPPRMTKTQWTAEMQKMQHVYGAPIDDTEIKLLGIYLTATYGDATTVTSEDKALGATESASTAVAPVAARFADAAQTLLNANGCLDCHSLKEKIVGPAYHDVATKYRSQSDALSKVEASIERGGVGRWGNIPMPPFANLTPTQLRVLAEFVLAQ
jgi:cytochrome c551/c552